MNQRVTLAVCFVLLAVYLSSGVPARGQGNDTGSSQKRSDGASPSTPPRIDPRLNEAIRRRISENIDSERSSPKSQPPSRDSGARKIKSQSSTGIAADGPQSVSRRWSSPTGTVLAEGSFLSFDDDKVRVRLSSGKIGRIALSKLSAEDQQYVQEQLARDGIFGEPGQGFEIEADDRGERGSRPATTGSPISPDGSVDEVEVVARSTLLWIQQFVKMERDFRKSFDPVWKTTRESKDEAVLHDAYVKAHSLVGDFVVKVKAIPNDNLDPDLLEHSLAKLAFYRNTQANAGALARIFQKILQLTEYSQSPNALADGFISGLAGDPAGPANRVAQLRSEYNREYNSLIDQQNALVTEENALTTQIERLLPKIKTRYGKYFGKLSKEMEFSEE